MNGRSRNGDGARRKPKSKRKRRGRGRSTPVVTAKTAGDFWGDVDNVPPVEAVALSSDPSAVVRSLGRPPLAGHEAVSEHYFRAVYERAVMLAEVLATAGDLVDVDEIAAD